LNCSGHGVCSDDSTCFCDLGYSGPDCSVLTCPLDCHVNGDCRNGTCFCHPGFLGSQCELGPYQGNCYNNCSDHGHCVILDPLFDPHTIECHCDIGWDGSDCSIPSCHQQCSGNGACHQDGSCQCYSGWTGADCADPLCPNDCNSQVADVLNVICIRVFHYTYRDLASVVLDACVILSFQGLIARFLDALRIVLSMVYVWAVIAHAFTVGEVMRVNQ
jgi:hypothetical protein